MSLRKILGLVCPIIGMTCLVVGYAVVGQWLALGGVLIALLAWLFTWNRPSGWLPFAALALSISLSAAGLFAGAPPVPMLLSAGLALAGWDVALLDHTLTGNPSAQAVSLLENRHYRSLALAVGIGLLAAITGRIFHIRIPFGGMILLVILAFIGLECFWRTLRG
jgi:hypothetical protein